MEWTLDKCRLVYNDMLEGMNEQEKPDRVELQNSIPKLKEKYPELKGVYSKVNMKFTDYSSTVNRYPN